LITSPQTIDGAVNDLRSIDRSGLAAGDLDLLDSALAMAGQIRKMPEIQSQQVSEKKPDLTKAAVERPMEVSASAQGLEQLQALSKARDALSRVDKLIKN
jgi:chemotaxis protein MotC